MKNIFLAKLTEKHKKTLKVRNEMKILYLSKT